MLPYFRRCETYTFKKSNTYLNMRLRKEIYKFEIRSHVNYVNEKTVEIVYLLLSVAIDSSFLSNNFSHVQRCVLNYREVGWSH